jgi:arylsulfatase A-like enzyme
VNNVLIIHTDQHRWDCLGAYGNRDIRTPHLDSLAADAITFDNSFCAHPVCTPSRYSLLTGLYPHQHLGLTNHSTLPAGLATFPRLLRQSGYRTHAVGKMHFTPAYLDVGFDRMELAEQHGPGRYADDYHRWLAAQGLCDRVDLVDQVAEYRRLASEEYYQTFGAQPSDLDEAHHSTTWIGNRAVAALDQWRDENELLMVGFIKPHHPFDPPAPWHAMYDPAGLSLLPGWTPTLIHKDTGRGYFDCSQLTESRLRRVMAYYYATISQIDHHIGRILGLLKARGLYDQTLILFTSDHGEYMGFHHRLLKGYRLFDPLARVPLILKPPGGGGGRRDRRLVSGVDVAPTLLAAAGLTPARGMKGLNLLDPALARPAVLTAGDGEHMVRTSTRKLLVRAEPSRSMFFDLQADPLEMTNLIDEPGRQAEIAGLREFLMQWLLYDPRALRHLDEIAPQIPHASTAQDHQRQVEYFSQQMAQRTA